MVRPKTIPDPAFIKRLEEISGKSRSALAKKAGMSPGSFQNWFTGTEPTRPMLVAIARAAGVSVNWLATGEEPRRPTTLPFFDLRPGNPDDLVYPLFSEHRAEERVIRQDLIFEIVPPSGSAFLVRVGADFPPHISSGDELMISGLLRDASLPPEAWPFGIDERAIYLVARHARALLRKLRKRKDRIEVIKPDGKVDFEVSLKAREPDFLMFGAVVWRAGAIPPYGDTGAR